MGKPSLAIVRQKNNGRNLWEVDITESEVKLLRQLVDYEGLKEMERLIGVCDVTILRVCGGWFSRCRPEVKKQFRKFFQESEY
jgi:hypothetical protein